MWVEEKSIKQPSNSKNCWCIVWRCVSTRVWWNVWNSPWVTTVFALKCDLAKSLYIILEAQVWCGGSSSVLREFQSQMIAGLWMSSRGSETHTGYYTHMWCHVKSDLKGAELFLLFTAMCSNLWLKTCCVAMDCLTSGDMDESADVTWVNTYMMICVTMLWMTVNRDSESQNFWSNL